MTIRNTVKAGLATLALVSTAANADILYFENFDGTNTDYTIATNNPSKWKVHDGSGLGVYNSGSDSANPGFFTTTAKDNMIGHASFGYVNYEKSIFTFSVDARGYKNLSLMFDWGAILRDSTYDGASLVAYSATLDTNGDVNNLNTSTTGAPGYTLLTPTNVVGGDFSYSPTGGYLSGAQNGSPDYGTVLGYNGAGSPYSEGGTAMFDVSGAGFSDEVVNFRLAFGSSNSNNSDGINFDNFKVTGDCIPGAPCDPMGGQTPEPGTLTLAALGLAAAYRSRKRKAA